MEEKERPLAQVEDMEELKERYRAFPSEKLRRWVELVVGPHREAMAALLRERDGLSGEALPGGENRA